MMTAREDWSEEAQLNEARLQALLRLSQMTEAPLREITDYALEQAVALTKSTIGYLAFVNEDQTVLTMHSWSQSAMAECAIVDKPRVYPLETTGLWGEAVRQRRPIVTNDYAAPVPLKRGLPPGHVPLRRHLNVPIFKGNKIVVVAGVGNKVTDYDDADTRQLTLLMDGMWMLLERRQVQEELRRHRDHLEQLVAERTAELAHEIEERKQAHEALRAERERLRAALAVQERERRLIAYEIHDGLAQHLAGAMMQAQSLHQLPALHCSQAVQALEALEHLIDESLREARGLISGLRPPSLDDYGAEAAIEEFLARNGHEVPIEFVSHLGSNRLPSALENVVFRIVQEGVNNACRHSRTDHVRVMLLEEQGSIRVEIQDWGTGFDPTQVQPDCYGLEGIRERARLLGGQAAIESRLGQGTRITVTLPVDSPAVATLGK
jgi:signal transduction histidine kinase